MPQFIQKFKKKFLLERQKGRAGETETQRDTPSVGLFPKYPQQLKPGTWISVWVFHINVRDSSTGAITAFFQVYSSRKLESGTELALSFTSVCPF